MTVYRGQRDATRRLTGAPADEEGKLFPVKYGYQVVGTVVEAGPQSGFSAGEDVFAYHPHQTEFVLSGDRTYRVPAGVPMERAAFGNLYCVAMNAILDAPVRPGDVVVVSGAGTVGVLAATIARRMAGTLILVEPLAARADLASALCEPDFVVSPEEAADVISFASNGRGADLWIEASGAVSAPQLALTGIGHEGTIVVISYFGNKVVPLTLSPEFMEKRVRLMGSFVSYIGSGLQPRWDERRRMGWAMRDLQRINTERLITQRMPFGEASSAYRLIDERPADTMSVLLEYPR